MAYNGLLLTRAIGRHSRRWFGLVEPITVVLVLAACLMLRGFASAQVKPVRRVLILNELGPASPAINLIDGEIRATLESSRYQIELYAENLETTLFPDPSAQKEFLESYIHKYRGRKPDVIVAVGPSPLHFLAESHEKFFTDTPVVFCVSTPGMVGNPKLDSQFTGVWETPDFTKTVDVALRLLPDTKHIVVVGGVADYDRANEAITRDGLRTYESRFDVTYLTDLDMPTLLERLKRLPKDSIVLQSGISEDAAGTRYIIATQSDPMVAQAANAPVFPAGDMADVDVGTGAVGGYLVSFEKEGRIAAADAARIINGEKPSDIPIVRGANAYIFDWRALKRWGLRENDLPPGSLVLYRQRSFWELHWKYILLAIFVLLIQSAVIVGLLWQRRQRRKAQAELISSFGQLHDSEERFRSAMHNVASGLYTLDLQGVVTYVNPAAEAIFQWTYAELLGKKMHDVTHYKHPDGTPFPASDCPGLQVLQKGIELRDHEDVFIRKDGSFFPVVLSASPLKKKGETVGIVVGFRDDTEHRDAAQAVQESEERFRFVANTAPVTIWMTDVDNNCTYANQHWLDFTGRSLESQLGMGWLEPIHPEDLKRSWEVFEKASAQHAPFQLERRTRRHDGEYRWMLVSGVPRFNIDGLFAGYIGSAIDITEHKLAEEALSTVSQKLVNAHEEERTRIARELHDDINQRLALLAVTLEGLKENLPAAALESRGRTEEAGKEVADIAKEIQALSHRLHSSKLELLGLERAAASFCKELSSRQAIEIDFHSEDVPKEVPDEVALSLFRVLQEALQNAIKHSGSRHFRVSLRREKNDLELTVQDSGIGFEPEVAIKGQGLGLTSMQERLRLVGGQLFVESKPQHGTTVRARVGFGDGAKVRSDRTTSRQERLEPIVGHVRVLVVEDYEPFRRFVCSALQRRDEFGLTEASDGLEAVQKAVTFEPDLILLDIGLPKLHGFEVAKRIRSQVPRARILFVSQESSSEVIEEAFRVGGQGYVHKSHAQSDLMDAIDAVLEGERFVTSGLKFGDTSASIEAIPRLVLAENHPAMREMIAKILHNHFDLVASVETGLAALEAANKFNPDVLVMDVLMQGLEGRDVAKQLKDSRNDAKIVFVSASMDAIQVSSCLAAGGHAYVSKMRMATDLPIAIRKVLVGEGFVSPA